MRSTAERAGRGAHSCGAPPHAPRVPLRLRARRARLAPDAASVAGLLHLRKLPALGAPAPPRPEAPLHLLRHKRRRLAITPVEIDPGGGGDRWEEVAHGF